MLSNSDVLINFNGQAHLKENMLPKKFSGLKIYHTMDYSHNTKECVENLKRSCIDYLLGYTRHDLFCHFFQTYFKSFKERVIPVPFGHSKRYFNQKLPNRNNIILGTGAINRVTDINSKIDSISEYVDFFKKHDWAHPTRKQFYDLSKDHPSLIQNYFTFKKSSVKFKSLDMSNLLNSYTFFLNETTIMDFPPARTYEGIACGSIMIAPESESLKLLGLKNNTNCFFISQKTLSNQSELIIELKKILKSELLFEIKKESLQLAKNFTHEKIAKNLNKEIYEKFK